jgi:ATP-binding cassette, subfamily C (CFTR/MRP), member 1
LFIIDLWELPPHQVTSHITDSLEANFFSRCPPADRPHTIRDKLRADERNWNTEENGKHGKESDIESISAAPEPELRSETNKKYDSSLAKAVFYTFRGDIVTSGVLKLIAGMQSAR